MYGGWQVGSSESGTFPSVSLHCRALLSSSQSENARGLSRPESEQRVPAAQRMLCSSRSTQLPGAQVARLLLCRGLCVRGQHTKTHFLPASFPDRPAHDRRPVAFQKPPQRHSCARVPDTWEQRLFREPLEPISW